MFNPAYLSNDHVRVSGPSPYNRVQGAKQQRSDDHPGILGSGETQAHPARPKSRTNSPDRQVTQRPFRNKDSGTQVRYQDQATQIYLKTKSQGMCPPFVCDQEERDTFIYNLLQEVIQKIQQHMYSQLQQCIQQTYLGLTLGTPVHAKKFVSQFTTDNVVVLTKSKHIETVQKSEYKDWNTDDTWEGAQGNSSTPVMNCNNTDTTTPKTVDNTAPNSTTNHFGGARHKTGFLSQGYRPRATVAGQPAGSEDPDNYFNPLIVNTAALYATSLSFVAVVDITSRLPRQQGNPQGHQRPWDNRLYGRRTISQEALRTTADRKVKHCYPDYKN